MNSHKKTRSLAKFQSAKEVFLGSPTVFEQFIGASQLKGIVDAYSKDFRNRIFPPLTTLWVFISQILNSDHSCRAAVAKYLATLGDRTCSLSTGAYCQARKRLKEDLLQHLFLAHAEQLQNRIERGWLWKARHVKLVDGSTVSMPDTSDNQKHFPATNRAKNPIEFPIARIVVVICKTTGNLVNAAIGSYQGKGSGETSLLKQLLGSFAIGDICLFDRYYSGFFSLASLLMKEVDVVSRQHHLRKVKSVKRLGKNDHLFYVKRPAEKPTQMSQEEYNAYPAEIRLRRIQVFVHVRGFRTRKMEVITSLLGPDYSAADIAELYRDRWFVELDIRSIKSEMGMEILRCQTAEMIRKEIWAHFLTYNLIRAVIMDAARLHQMPPRQVSFKAALQLVFALRQEMAQVSNSKWLKLYLKILLSLKTQTIGKRPNRYEPRLKKRRPNDKYLRTTRNQARRKCEIHAA